MFRKAGTYTNLRDTNMAAPCSRIVKSVLQKGVQQVGRGRLWWARCDNKTQTSLCLTFSAGGSRPLHLSPAPTQSNLGAEDPLRSSHVLRKNDKKTKDYENEEYEGPEYIPKKKKAKNPMMKIGYAWMVGLPTGIIGFVLAKRQVDKNRLKQLKIRQRMKSSNEGEYEGSRYRHHTVDAKLD